jgi:hypothetical protein
MILGASIMPKKFSEIDTCGQFHYNFFGLIYNAYQCIALSSDLSYAARGLNYIEKSFMKLPPVAN